MLGAEKVKGCHAREPGTFRLLNDLRWPSLKKRRTNMTPVCDVQKSPAPVPRYIKQKTRVTHAPKRLINLGSSCNTCNKCSFFFIGRSRNGTLLATSTVTLETFKTALVAHPEIAFLSKALFHIRTCNFMFTLKRVIRFCVHFIHFEAL